MVEIFGQEASGKTTLALHVIAEAQKVGKGKIRVGPILHVIVVLAISSWALFIRWNGKVESLTWKPLALPCCIYIFIYLFIYLFIKINSM